MIVLSCKTNSALERYLHRTTIRNEVDPCFRSLKLLYARTHKRCWTFFFLLLIHRKPHMKRASSGWTAFSPDNTIMEFDNAFAHRQAKTEPIDLPDQAVGHTMEAIKDAPKVLGRNTQAVITHTDFEDAPCFPHHCQSMLEVRIFAGCRCFLDLIWYFTSRQEGGDWAHDHIDGSALRGIGHSIL